LTEHVPYQDRNAQLLQTLRKYYGARMPISTPLTNVSLNQRDWDRSPDNSSSDSLRPMPIDGDVNVANSTRELLRTIALLSEEVMVASHEKLGVARFACELVSGLVAKLLHDV
jgi:hypothetical protein